MLEFKTLRTKDELRVESLIKRVKQIKDMPELFTSDEMLTPEEEADILARTKFRKSNIRVVAGKGQPCTCEHGRAEHLYENTFYRTGRCSLKSCKCKQFSPKH